MNRRSLLRLLPFSALALPKMVAAEPAATPEPSPWVEATCQHRLYDMSAPCQAWEDQKECGTRFRFIRGTVPRCPNCWMASILVAGQDEDKVVGIEIK